MNQEELERRVMEKLLDGNNEIFIDLYKQYQNAVVTTREFTGCGFYTTFDVQVYKPKYSVKGRIDDVAIEFEETNEDGCFILYIRDGKIDVLEGFGFEDWNDNYDNGRIVYCLPGQRRYELKQI